MTGFSVLGEPFLADGIDLPLVLFYGLLILVPLMAFQVVVEGGILGRIWGIQFKTLVRAVFVANCWSFIAGIPTKVLNAWLYTYILPSELIGYFDRYPFAIALGTVIYFVVTVLVEGIYMRSWLAKTGLPRSRFWSGILISNTATYLVLAPLHYFGTRPIQDVREYTAGTGWAEKPPTQIVYIDSRSGYLKGILSDGSNLQILASVPTTNYSVSLDLATVWIQDRMGSNYLYRGATRELVPPGSGTNVEGPKFGPSHNISSTDFDSFAEWRVRAVHGLGNSLYIFRTDESPKDYVRVAVNPGLLHIADFRYFFSHPAFLSQGRQCLFECGDIIYLLDIANRRVGRLADGKDFILLTDKYKRPQ